VDAHRQVDVSVANVARRALCVAAVVAVLGLARRPVIHSFL
jgi:hypothetical protein